MDAPGFFLTEASASERTARDRLTFDAWGARLTKAQYLDRECLLRQTDHGRRSMTSWVLRVQSGVVVASCETFRLPLLPTGVIEVIASVYVDGPLRGAKMASRMLDAVVKHRREAGIDGLVLFSEVGETLYARAGFRLLPTPTRRWATTSNTAPPVRVIRDIDLPEALGRRDQMRAGRVDIRLLESIFDWHQARSRFYAETLQRPLSSIVGAWDGQVQALWLPDYKNAVLRVMDASGPAGASLEKVIAVASREAAVMGMGGVELWDDSQSAQLTGGREIPREDDLPMGIAFTPRGELFMGPLSRACWA